MSQNTLKRGARGLYHGKKRLTGNTISFSHRRNKRAWLPNVQAKNLRSELLDQEMKLKVTTKALRCIDKAGGLDAYLLTTKAKDLHSATAIDLRRQLKKIVKQQKIDQREEEKKVSPVAIASNTQAIYHSRILSGLFGGALAGIMGFEWLGGLLTFVLFSLILHSFLLVSFHGIDKINGNFSKSWVSALFTQWSSGLMTFVLLWTLFYNLVHVY